MNTTSMDQILDALDIEALEPKEKEELLLELNGVIFRGSLIRLLEMMDVDTRDEYLALVESDADEHAIEQFLRERVPNAGDAVIETVEELADDILAGTGTNQ